MKNLPLLSAVALFLAMAFSSQSTYGGAATGEVPEVGYWWSYPYGGDYPHGCRAGCCRRPVWSGRHWHNVTTCQPLAWRALRRASLRR
jgi:hypothetical protein